MGAFKGAVTYQVYFVEGDLPKEFRDRFLENIEKEAFAPLTPDSLEERHFGWVNIQHPIDVKLSLPAKVYLNEYLCLGLRIDRWSLPSALLKARITEAERDHLRQTKGAKLGRTEREAIKERVTSDMKAQMLPTMKVVDMIWSLNHNVVRFWSPSQKLGEEFSALFEQTFGLRLIPDSPFTAAAALEFNKPSLEALASLTPEYFGAANGGATSY